VSTTAVVLVVATAAAFPLLLWAIGRGVTAAASRAPSAAGRPRQYLAGRLYGVWITALIDGEDELLVSLVTEDGQDPLAGVFRVTASECSLGRVRRWREEGTSLRGYLSENGAIMLADPVLGGNAACEPPITAVWAALKRSTSQDQRLPEDT
jgi:hypothetical protein